MTVENEITSNGNGILSFDGADPLLDLNLFYIRQIGASLRKHVGIQDKLEREIKLRDGASRMLAACTHEDQLLEVAKTLHTSNARMYTYMAELQKLKRAEIMEKVMDEEGIQNESKVCTGRVAISDIRIPLMWNDPERFSGAKVKEASRYAVFCLVRVVGEVLDTELVCMDKTTTDLTFRDILVFEDASHNFKMDIEIYAFPMSEEPISAPTPQKLFSRLNRSIGKSEGKRIRDRLKDSPAANMKIKGPQYEKLGSLTLDLTSVDDHIKSHDIAKISPPTCSSNRSKPLLPLYGNLTCRLVAQPKCMTEKCVTGFLHCMEVGKGCPCWSYMWCEAKAGKLQCWLNPEDAASKHAQCSVDLIGHDVKINEIEKNRQKRPNSFQVRDLVNRHMFSASNKEEMTRWIKNLRQHRADFAAWSIVCIPEKGGPQPMFIGSPSPNKTSSRLLFDPSVRKTFIYEQMSMESPTKGDSEAVEVSDILKNVLTTPEPVMTSASEANQSTPWAGLFNGALNCSATKVIKLKDVQHVDSNCSEPVKKPLRSRTKSNNSILSSLKSSKAKSNSQRPPIPHRPSEESLKCRKKLHVKSPTSARPVPKIDDLKSCNTSESCSETGLSDFCQSSDDVFLSSDENLLDSPSGKKKSSKTSSSKLKAKKKRRAPLPPVPNGNDVQADSLQTESVARSMSKASLSSVSSLDDILDMRKDPRKPPRLNASNRISQSKSNNVYIQDSDAEGRKSQISLTSNSTQASNVSSGYKSDSERLAAVSVSSLIPRVISPCRPDYCEIEITDRDVKSKMKAMTGVKVLPTELPIGVKLNAHKFSRSRSCDSDSVLRDENADTENQSTAITRHRFCSIPTKPPYQELQSTPKSIINKKDKLIMQMLKPMPTPRRSYLTAVESSKVASYSAPLYDVPDCAELISHPVEDIYAVPIPKALRPSTKSNRSDAPEPIYAQVDKTKKSNARQQRKIGVDAYTKAHKAIITVCKQRMEEEEEKARKNSEDDIVYV